MSDRKRKIVTLCGSSFFVEAFAEASRTETLAGNIVLSIGMFGHHEGIDMDGPIKAELDELHFDKVRLSDEILVLNVKTLICASCGKRCAATDWSNSDCCGESCDFLPYTGYSTRREIDFAKSIGVIVRYLNPPI